LHRSHEVGIGRASRSRPFDRGGIRHLPRADAQRLERVGERQPPAAAICAWREQEPAWRRTRPLASRLFSPKVMRAGKIDCHPGGLDDAPKRRGYRLLPA
jgi:hypothetical protein